MIIDCISDLHGFFPELQGGDLLIIAGDLTARDRIEEYWDCFDWMVLQKYKKIIYIGGNHDNVLQNNPPLSMHPTEGMLTYLCDSGTEFEGLKVWGSPWIKRFRGMNKHCIAFTVDSDEELAEKWALIPEDTDILITHSPPYAVGDKCTSGVYPEWVGSKSLALEHKNRLKCKLHVFGHIHEAYCQEILTREVDGSEIILVNASHVNQFYQPVNKPIRIEL